MTKNNRYLILLWNCDQQKRDFKDLIDQPRHKKGFSIRNLKPKFRKIPLNQPSKIQLVGYDGLVKYQAPQINEYQLQKIYRLIDDMPMGKQEAKARKKKNMELYSDRNPETTLHGTGFKDAAKAKHTIELVKNRPLIYQFQVINTMYYRAKHHPHRTKEMEQAMKILKSWLDKYKSKK